MTQLLKDFLGYCSVIINTCEYENGAKGDNGKCDCIGMIIGAQERCGVKWTGIHGSNYAARKQSVEFKQITSVNQLSVGDLVFKANPEGSSGWNLPSRYQKGGTYYNGDLNDYYHVGVVTSVSPLNITHMTSPKGLVDKKLGKWGYYCKSRPLVMAGAYDEEPSPEPEPGPSPEPTPAPEPVYAYVYSENGKPVNFRKAKNINSTLIDRINVGVLVEVLDAGDEWSKIKWNNKTGYMMSKFLISDEEPQPEPAPEPTPSEGSTATVVAASGKYVKLRQKPSTSCRLYDDVPIGAVVTIVSPGEEWAKVNYGWRKGWYMMSKFLEAND